MKKTVLVIAVIILFFGAAAWFAARLLSPGSYVNAEEYELNASENVIINAISKFKQNHPEYNLPIELNQADGRKDSSDYWYPIYFYYPKENQIVYASFISIAYCPWCGRDLSNYPISRPK